MVFVADDDVPARTIRLFNAADAHCELCEGMGQKDGVACPCTADDPGAEMIGQHHVDGSDTEVQAAASVRKPASKLRRQVLEALARAGDDGLTDFELARNLKHPIRHSPGTRREELIEGGWPIVDTGRRRPTDTGRQAIVWALAAIARDAALAAVAPSPETEAAS